MYKKLLLSLGLICSLSVYAQNQTDALRYSQESLWGSARYTAMGGAFGALGATGMSASYNPAGIAVLTTGQFSTTFNLHGIENEGVLYGETQFSQDKNFSIPNINYSTANIFDPAQVGDWNRYNFGIGYNKLDDYNSHTNMSVEQNQSSLVDLFLSRTYDENNNGYTPNELNSFHELLAFNTYLIDTVPGTTDQYFSTVSGDLNKLQSFKHSTSGSKNEFYLSFGTAYKNKLFLGATLGFPSFVYRENIYISEKNIEHETEDGLNITSFNYESSLYAKGSGINLKLGLIYKLEDHIRYGFALHTPTSYEISEEYQTQISTLAENDDSFHASSALNLFDYNLRSPFKVINSLSLIINKMAIISVDYEYLNYSSSKLFSDFANFDTANEAIKNDFSSTHNLKLGAEVKAHEQLSLRAGYSYYGSPYIGNDSKRESLSCGIGIQVEQYFFDLALVKTLSQSTIPMYGTNELPIESQHNQALISAGIKF